MTKNYYFTGQQKEPFRYFNYGKILSFGIEKGGMSMFTVDGYSLGRNGKLIRDAEMKLPVRVSNVDDDPYQYNVDKETAQQQVIRFLLGEIK